MTAFQFALIDPPWKFLSRGRNGDGRAPRYQTQGLDWIRSLDVLSVLDRDAVVGLWTTDPFLESAFEVVRAWNDGAATKAARLRYSSVLFYWAKLRATARPGADAFDDSNWLMGNGYGTRANVEPCLLFVRGRGLPRLDRGVRRLIVAPVGEHSAKPGEAYRRAARLYGPGIRRADIFARQRRPGWSLFGDEAPGGTDFHIETRART